MVVGCVARVMWWMASSHTDGQDTWFVHKIKNDSILFLEMVDKTHPQRCAEPMELAWVWAATNK